MITIYYSDNQNCTDYETYFEFLLSFAMGIIWDGIILAAIIQ